MDRLEEESERRLETGRKGGVDEPKRTIENIYWLSGQLDNNEANNSSKLASSSRETRG